MHALIHIFHEQLKVTNSNTPSTFLWEALLITSNPISFSIRFVELKQLINHIKDHFNFGLSTSYIVVVAFFISFLLLT